jgi:hypothetical protein
MNGFKAEKKVELGGKKRLLKFGTNSSAIYCSVQKCSLNEMQHKLSNMGADDLQVLIYAMAYAGHVKEHKQEPEFTRWDVGEWLDDEGAIERSLEFINSIDSPSGKAGKGK